MSGVEKGLTKQVGPMKVWQWAAIGGATIALVLLIKSRKGGAAGPEVNPEAEEKLLGALRQGSGGGGGELGGGSGGAVSAPLPGETGPAGAPGEVGAQGVAGESPGAGIEGRLSTLEQEVTQNHPQATTHTTAPAKTNSNLVRNPANGEQFRVVHKGGKTYHEYPGRTGNKKLVQIGGKPQAHAHASKPAKRPKPTPIHKRVAVHHPAAKKAKAPVHHAAPHAAKPKPHHPPAKRRRR